jgi:hypothetical protein
MTPYKFCNSLNLNSVIKYFSCQCVSLKILSKMQSLYRLSEKGVQTLVWQNQAKAWTPSLNDDDSFLTVSIVCQINILAGVQTLVWQNQAKAGRLLFLKAYICNSLIFNKIIYWNSNFSKCRVGRSFAATHHSAKAKRKNPLNKIARIFRINRISF